MRKLALFVLAVALGYPLYNQCTPEDCSPDLPPYGGICDDAFNDGLVNEAYDDFESFVITMECFDAGLIDPNNAGVIIFIDNISNFSFSGLPDGLVAETDQPSYFSVPNDPTLGCIALEGTPTEAGLFEATAEFDAVVEAFPFGGCPGGFGISQTAGSSYALNLLILPDPSFEGLEEEYCEADDDVEMIVTGTEGGTFSGPGVNGNMFSPSEAGPGFHTISYTVSAEEGDAVGPAENSMDFELDVFEADEYYLDNDDDTWGDEDEPILTCDGVPDGYSFDSGDCDDDNDEVFPGAEEICNGIDDNCDGDIDEGFDLDNDGFTTCQGDCNDEDDNIGPDTEEMCNGIDDNCDGNIDEGFDGDNDGFTSCGGDCDDTNSAINPDAVDTCDGVDQNCDGFTLNNVTVALVESICIGESIEVGGELFSEEGDYSVTIEASNSCDSTIELSLSHIGEIAMFQLPEEDTLCIGAEPVDLILLVSPDGGTFTGAGITGSIFNPGEAGEGEHIIEYTVGFDDCSYSAAIRMVVDLCTYATDLEAEIGLNIYPNPFQNQLYLSLAHVHEGKIEIDMIDMSGNSVKPKFEKQRVQSNLLLSMDTRLLTPGIFLIKIKTGKGLIIKKVILSP